MPTCAKPKAKVKILPCAPKTTEQTPNNPLAKDNGVDGIKANVINWMRIPNARNTHVERDMDILSFFLGVFT